MVKASGLAAGKGVIVANDVNEACAAVDEILGDMKYGSAGSKIVVEEKLSGEEVSVCMSCIFMWCYFFISFCYNKSNCRCTNQRKLLS